MTPESKRDGAREKGEKKVLYKKTLSKHFFVGSFLQMQMDSTQWWIVTGLLSQFRVTMFQLFPRIKNILEEKMETTKIQQ